MHRSVGPHLRASCRWPACGSRLVMPHTLSAISPCPAASVACADTRMGRPRRVFPSQVAAVSTKPWHSYESPSEDSVSAPAESSRRGLARRARVVRACGRRGRRRAFRDRQISRSRTPPPLALVLSPATAVHTGSYATKAKSAPSSRVPPAEPPIQASHEDLKEPSRAHALCKNGTHASISLLWGLAGLPSAERLPRRHIMLLLI